MEGGSKSLPCNDKRSSVECLQLSNEQSVFSAFHHSHFLLGGIWTCNNTIIHLAIYIHSLWTSLPSDLKAWEGTPAIIFRIFPVLCRHLYT